jgi:hypothetical protein
LIFNTLRAPKIILTHLFEQSLPYSLYAFLLDVLGLGLIVFTITGIIMWFKLLKNSTIAWVIFISGFIYFGLTMALLVYW